MAVLTSPGYETREAYDAIAPAYDLLTGGYDHERWLFALENLAEKHGLCGRRLLDVACGTGASFVPLLARGYDVTAVDISPQMLERARRKAPQARLHLADMRQLPDLGRFDLVTCLDDALNYILDEAEFQAVLRGFAENLAPGGIALWDLNTLAQYHGQFASDQVINQPDLYIGWKGQSGTPAVGPGECVEIQIDVFSRSADDAWQRAVSVHRQRHWPQAEVERLAHQAGLKIVDVRGQRPGAIIDGALDELTHIKAIYLATRRREVSS